MNVFLRMAGRGENKAARSHECSRCTTAFESWTEPSTILMSCLVRILVPHRGGFVPNFQYNKYSMRGSDDV